MVSALDSGSGGPGLSPRWGHCDVFLGKTLYSHSASLHPGIQMGTSQLHQAKISPLFDVSVRCINRRHRQGYEKSSRRGTV